jgi:hypothetical protein
MRGEVAARESWGVSLRAVGAATSFAMGVF